MRFLHVVDSMDPSKGGVSEAVRTMATALTNAGEYNEVLTLDDPTKTQYAVPFQVHAIGPSKGPWHYSSLLMPWLRAHYQQYDIIILHGLWLYVSFAVKRVMLKLAKISRKDNTLISTPRIYIMPHGMLDPYFQRSTNRKYKAIRNWLYWKIIESGLVNEAEGMLFTCNQERILARQPFRPYHPRQELIVGLGVSTPPAFTQELNINFNRIFSTISFGSYLLFLGRIDQKKGIDILLQAYHRLLQSAVYPSSSKVAANPYQEIPKLVIAGPGMESAYGKKLLEYVQDKPTLASKVFITGMQQGDAKWSLLYGCEAFILPSHQENFGLSVVEALACGKPVLISNQVNIFTEVCSEHAGFNADDTAEGTYCLLQTWINTSNNERQQMGAAAKRCYQKHFALQAATNRLQEVLLHN